MPDAPFGQSFVPGSFEYFSYDEVLYDELERRVFLHYSLHSKDEVVPFVETVTLPSVIKKRPHQALLRLLWLVAGLSYFKMAAPSEIRFPQGVRRAERVYLASLIRGGLGEFAFVNSMETALTPTIVGPHLEDSSEPHQGDDWSGEHEPLVPVGGGKDSVASIVTLQRAGITPILFSVNRYPAIDRCVAVAGEQYVWASRALDPAVNGLNARGALNGHIPVTAINSAIALIVADGAGFGSVVMSNEESANHGNVLWRGFEINHQWSKSLDAEVGLRAYLAGSDLQEDRYFSLLRPLNEFTIARLFAESPEYLDAFTSCNRAFSLDVGRRSESWCGECPKCEFVFLILAPWVPKDRLVGVFGANLLGDADRLTGYRALLGLGEQKPFECVGGFDEAAAALLIAAARPEWAGDVVVEAVAPELAAVGRMLGAEAEDGVLWSGIPERFREAIRARVLR